MAGYTKNPTDNALTPNCVGSTNNKGGDSDSGRRLGGDPFSYVKVEPEHAYLGHFREKRYLEAGHNTRRIRRIAASGIAVDPTVNPILAAKVARRRAVMAGEPAARGAVRAARAEARSRSRGEKRAARASVRQITRQARRGLSSSSSGGY